MNKDVSISINNEYTVYDSGSVITHDDKPIIIKIATIKASLEVKFVFKTDETVKGLPVKGEISSDKQSMTMTLTNFNSVLCGVDKIHEIGHLDGQPLFLQFMVSGLNNSGTKIFYYTFFLKKES
jgi:hypothetical protein